MGGIILILVPSAIQLGCVNSPVFRVENNIGKLVFWRDVSYSPKLTSLWNIYICLCVILDKNQLNLMRLVHAMRSNGPLPQVHSFLENPCLFPDECPQKLQPCCLFGIGLCNCGSLTTYLVIQVPQPLNHLGERYHSGYS